MHWTATAFRRALVTNAADTDFPAKIPTITEPSGDGVHTLAKRLGLPVPYELQIIPFGTGTDGATFDLKVIGWRRTLGLTKTLWIPVPLLKLACTLSTAVGVAGSDVVATERFVDTISVTLEGMTRDGELVPSTDAVSFTSSGTVVVTSPADNTLAMAEYCVKGFEKIEFIFDLGASATGANALVAFN